MSNEYTKRARAEAGRKGGQSRSRRKVAAIRRNIAKARAARWPKKGGAR